MILGWAVWAVLGCGAPREVDPVLALVGDARRGEAQYQIECARCHGAEGHGVGQVPALAGRIDPFDDRAVVEVVVRGRGGMPAQRIDDQTVADVLAWMRQRWPGSE